MSYWIPDVRTTNKHFHNTHSYFTQTYTRRRKNVFVFIYYKNEPRKQQNCFSCYSPAFFALRTPTTLAVAVIVSNLSLSERRTASPRNCSGIFVGVIVRRMQCSVLHLSGRFRGCCFRKMVCVFTGRSRDSAARHFVLLWPLRHGTAERCRMFTKQVVTRRARLVSRWVTCTWFC